MEGGGFFAGALLGAAIMWGYQSWREPVALANAADQIDGAYSLTKFMSGQVALIHGFLDDFEVCTTIRERLERDGGYYGCVAHEAVAENPY